MGVRRASAAAAVIAAAVLGGLGASSTVTRPPACSGHPPVATTDGGAGARPGTVRWRMVLECGGLRDDPWSSSDDEENRADVQVRSMVVPVGDVLLVSTPGSSQVHGYDLGTGTLRWTHELGAGRTARWGSGSSGLVAVWITDRDDRTGRSVVLDTRTGAQLWQRPVTAVDDPVVLDGGIPLLVGFRGLTALDPATGAVRWYTDLPNEQGLLRSDGRYAYGSEPASASVTRVRRVDLRNGRTSFLPLGEPVAGSLVAVHPAGVLVFADQDLTGAGDVTAVDARTGRVLWHRAGHPDEQAIDAGVLLYPLSPNPWPRALLLHPRTGEILYRPLPGATGWPVAYRPDLLIRGEAGPGGGNLAGITPDGDVAWRSPALEWPRDTWDTPHTVVVATCRAAGSQCTVRELVAVATG